MSRNLELESSILHRYERLWRVLWDGGESVRGHIFTQKAVDVPSFNEEKIEWNMRHYTILSLEHVIQDYLSDHVDEVRADWDNLLPCDANVLIFRQAYDDLIKCLTQWERERGYDGQDKSTRSKTDKGFIVSGHPGIGKTWFLTALLVHRLLRGEKAVLQLAVRGEYMHLLFDKAGVHDFSTVNHNDAVFRDIYVWALVDQQLHGFLKDHSCHQWRVVLTSSPKEGNYKQLVKDCSPPRYIMQTWEWGEIVAAW
jgi:hypothetical protein